MRYADLSREGGITGLLSPVLHAIIIARLYISFYTILYHAAALKFSPIFYHGTSGTTGPHFPINPSDKAIHYYIYLSIYSLQPILILL